MHKNFEHFEASGPGWCRVIDIHKAGEWWYVGCGFDGGEGHCPPDAVEAAHANGHIGWWSVAGGWHLSQARVIALHWVRHGKWINPNIPGGRTVRVKKRSQMATADTTAGDE